MKFSIFQLKNLEAWKLKNKSLTIELESRRGIFYFFNFELVIQKY